MRPTSTASGRRKAALTGLAVIALAIAACSPAATAKPAGPTTVDVTLQEWAIVPSVTTVKAGSVTFNAKNTGPEDQHEMVVMKTDLGILDLPKGADGKVDEEGAGVTAVGEIEEFAVGATGSVTLDLTAGKYVLICNIVEDDGTAHYGKGMTIAFTVE